MKSFSITDVGIKRNVNQDYIYCSENEVGILPNLFIVADGMGGHNAGDYAAKYCVESVVDTTRHANIKTPIGTLDYAIKKANEDLLKQAAMKAEYEGMGTTFVAATIQKDMMIVANVGDSRLYVINDSSITQITEDHSLVEAMIKNGEIERKEARYHPNKNIITRALGAGQNLNVDYFEVSIKQDDIVLMCSDGLTNMLEDEEIKHVIDTYSNDPQKAAGSLVDKANENGGKDNIAIIIIKA